MSSPVAVVAIIAGDVVVVLAMAVIVVRAVAIVVVVAVAVTVTMAVAVTIAGTVAVAVAIVVVVAVAVTVTMAVAVTIAGTVAAAAAIALAWAWAIAVAVTFAIAVAVDVAIVVVNGSDVDDGNAVVSLLPEAYSILEPLGDLHLSAVVGNKAVRSLPGVCEGKTGATFNRDFAGGRQMSRTGGGLAASAAGAEGAARSINFFLKCFGLLQW